MIEAIIFDIDGTLLDSVDLHARAWEEAFRHFGHEIAFEDVRKQIGKGGDQLLPVFLTKEELQKEGQALSDFRAKLFKDKYLGSVKPFPGVRKLFETVKEHGQKAALASSAKPDELEVYKRIAHIEDLVEVGTSSGDAEKSKPHPDIFEAALSRLGQVRPENVIAVGDTPYDAEAAGKAGMKTVGVLCGGFPAEELKAAGCIALYAGPQDLLEQYDESPLAPRK